MADIWEIATIIAAFAFAILAVRLAWAGWVAYAAWEVEHERARIETQRQRSDIVLVRPDAATGLLPVHRAMIEASTDAILAMTMARIQTMRLPDNVPQAITYSPHYAPHMRNDTRPVAQLAQPVGNLVNDDIPTAMECFARGMFDDPTQLLIGFNENAAPIYSAVEDTYGVAVAGVPGMGKTTGMRFWAVQMALHGAQMAIIDPAANSSSRQGLATSMSGLRDHLWEKPASEPDQIVRMLNRIEAIGVARGSGQDASTWPLMLMIDEMTALVTGERGDEIAALIKRIARQYRKEHLYTVSAGQDWLGDALGSDVGLRRAFVCRAVYRAEADVGRKLSVRKPLINLVPSLQRGQMVWVDPGANQSLVTVPDCSTACVAAILGTSTQAGSPSHTWKESPAPMLAEGAGKYTGSGLEVDGEAVIDAGKMRQIQDYGAQGWSTHKIVATVFGVTGGRAYGDGRELINKVLGREI